MHIIGWIVFGFVVGLLARAILPGEQKMGIIATTLLGIGGSLLGGFIANAVSHHHEGSSVGWIGSIIGAIVLLAVYMFVLNRTGHRTVHRPTGPSPV
jgi:uncharacterized membrane protein YeaQ/YmgE (transglycosylase-associated protein family)